MGISHISKKYDGSCGVQTVGSGLESHTRMPVDCSGESDVSVFC